jgi:hypothetical protein
MAIEPIDLFDIEFLNPNKIYIIHNKYFDKEGEFPDAQARVRFAQQIIRDSLSAFKCPKKDCRKSFLNEEYLKKHLLVDHVSKIEKKRLLVDHGGKAAMISELRSDRVSKIEKPYKCTKTQTCIDKKRSFETQRKLNQHMKIHGEKKFKCSQCEKAFPIKQYLDSHMMKHTGEKKYNCRKCNSSFSTSSSLKYHDEHLH